MSDGERDPLSRVPAPHQVAHPSLPRIPTATFSRHPSPRLWISPPGSHPSRTLALAALGLRFEEIKIEEEKHGPLPSLWSRDSCLDWGNVHLGREHSVSFTGSRSCLPSPPPPPRTHSHAGKGGGQGGPVSSPPLQRCSPRRRPCSEERRGVATSRTSALATSASGGHKAPPGQGQLHGRAAWAVAQGSGLGAAPSWAACEPPRASGDADSLLNEASRLHFAPGPWIPSLVLCPGNRTRTSGSGPAPSSASATCAAPHVRSERGRAADRPGGEGHAVANVGVPSPPPDAHAAAGRPGECTGSRGRGGTSRSAEGLGVRPRKAPRSRLLDEAERTEAPCVTPRPQD